MNIETQNYEEERKILDSGNRRKFASGAVRDIAEGKGRCDLLPLDIIGDYFGYRVPSDCGNPKYIDCILYAIKDFIYTGSPKSIHDAITMFMDNRGWSTITAILEVSKHYEEGAKKYDERNWEKGIPAHCYVDSGIRHLLKYYGKWDDEPHDRAFLWNMFGLLWTLKHHPELNDLPYIKTKLSEEEKDYIKKDIQLTKEAYHRIINDNYDNPLQAADDINELVEALEKGGETQ